ncbi:MAG: hypothetical protein AAF211_15830 [Myxococcota bacterium]
MQQPLLDAPRDAWLVYADYLQEQSDPRGRLILLNEQVAAGGDPGERDAWLATHFGALFGNLRADRVEAAWTYCVPTTVSVLVDEDEDAAATVEPLFDAPAAASMRRLRLVGRTPGGRVCDLSSAVARVAAALPETCTALELVDARAERARVLVSSDYEPGPNLVEFGPIAVAAAIPSLHELRVVTSDVEQIDLTDVDAPSLRHFALQCLRWAEAYGDGPNLGQILAAARWPQLRRLALRIPETWTYSWPSVEGAYVPDSRYAEESDYYEVDEDGWSEPFDWGGELGPLLQALVNTPIEHLALTSFGSSGPLLQGLVDQGLPATLRVLDLSDSDVSDSDVSTIVDNAATFANLDLLDLRGTFVTRADAFATLAPTVRVEPGQGHRYQFSVGME